MDNWLLALFIKPFIAAVFMLLILYFKYLFIRFFPESRIKRFLLLPAFKRKQPWH